MKSPRIAFGDKVRVRASSCTERDGIAGQIGIVYGFTTPSQTEVKVVGDTNADYAIAVMIEGKGSPIWITEELVEFLDHQPGTAVQIGNHRLIRDEQGQWREVDPNLNIGEPEGNE